MTLDERLVQYRDFLDENIGKLDEETKKVENFYATRGGFMSHKVRDRLNEKKGLLLGYLVSRSTLYELFPELKPEK